MQNEVIKYFLPIFNGSDIPGKSAFCVQRDKVNPDAFKHIFYELTQTIMELDEPKTVKNYRLFAVDGSTFTLPFTALDESYRNNDKSKKEHKEVHLNCIFDCENGFYVYASIRTDGKTGERISICF